jgi:hypothetical protein
VAISLATLEVPDAGLGDQRRWARSDTRKPRAKSRSRTPAFDKNGKIAVNDFTAQMNQVMDNTPAY